MAGSTAETASENLRSTVNNGNFPPLTSTAMLEWTERKRKMKNVKATTTTGRLQNWKKKCMWEIHKFKYAKRNGNKMTRNSKIVN